MNNKYIIIAIIWILVISAFAAKTADAKVKPMPISELSCSEDAVRKKEIRVTELKHTYGNDIYTMSLIHIAIGEEQYRSLVEQCRLYVQKKLPKIVCNNELINWSLVEENISQIHVIKDRNKKRQAIKDLDQHRPGDGVKYCKELGAIEVKN